MTCHDFMTFHNRAMFILEMIMKDHGRGGQGIYGRAKTCRAIYILYRNLLRDAPPSWIVHPKFGRNSGDNLFCAYRSAPTDKMRAKTCPRRSTHAWRPVRSVNKEGWRYSLRSLVAPLCFLKLIVSRTCVVLRPVHRGAAEMRYLFVCVFFGRCPRGNLPPGRYISIYKDVPSTVETAPGTPWSAKMWVFFPGKSLRVLRNLMNLTQSLLSRIFCSAGYNCGGAPRWPADFARYIQVRYIQQ